MSACIECQDQNFTTSLIGIFSHVPPKYIITGANIITNDRSEQFKINPHKSYESGVICEKCIVEFQRVDPNIRCYQCKTTFVELFKDINQAACLGCNSHVLDDYIIPAYGSRYDACSDSEYIRYVNGRPADIPVGSHLCDVCIRQLIDTNICVDPN